MRRLAGYMGAEDGTPAQADNADRLGGETPSAYDTFVVGDSVEAIEAVAEATAVAETSFSTSTETSAVITGTASFSLETSDLSDVNIWAQHNNATCDGDSRIPGALAWATVAEDGVEPLSNSSAFTSGIRLSPGDHSLTLCLDPVGGDVDVDAAGLTEVVSPSANSVISTPTPSAASPAGR